MLLLKLKIAKRLSCLSIPSPLIGAATELNQPKLFEFAAAKDKDLLFIEQSINRITNGFK